MTLRAEAAKGIRKSGVVAIVRTREPDRVTAIAEALLEGGGTAIEITRASAFLSVVKPAPGG
ncbi:MAG: hypothetical protein ABI488_18680 [Polyangiaceae bacterium]